MLKKYILLILSFLILSSSAITTATDLKVGDLIKPRLREYTNNPFKVQFEVDNINVLTANSFTVTVLILNAINQTLFQELIEAANLPANSSTTLMTEGQFTPMEPGEYTVSIEIEFGDDIDNSNNQKDFTFEAVEMVGTKIPPGMGVDISQIDFTFPGYEIMNSSTGLFYTDFNAIYETTQIEFGFINAFSPTLGWFIQNMIFDFNSGYPGLSGMFNLMSSGEDVTMLEACAILTEEPLSVFPEPLEYDNFTITDVEYNAQGKNEPIGSVGSPIPFENIPWDTNGKTELVWQKGHVNLEQDLNQCGPGALANSLQWLENEQNINVPHKHQKGIRDTSLVGEIDKAANRNAHQGVGDMNMLKGKLKYIDDNNLTNNLKVKHKTVSGHILEDTSVTVGNTTSNVNKEAISLIDWIISELKDDEDVELGVVWPGGGGHWVDLIGGGYVDGVPWVAWVHDAKQGYDDMGTASTADDTTKSNGGLDPKSAGYGWSYVVNKELLFMFGKDSSRGKLDLAFSESKDTTNTTSVSEKYINTIPEKFSLEQNYPNPFNPSTVIKYSIPYESFVQIKIYDVLGKLVRTLTSGFKNAGTYEFEFKADNLSSGIYIYTIEADNFVQSKKMLLLK